MKLKIKHFVMFSIGMVITYTIVVTILTSITSYDYSTYYTTFVGLFGGELVCSLLLKLFGEKDETISDDSIESNGDDNL